MAELEEALCADPEPHEPHDFPLNDSEWVGGPVWHCPGVAELPALSHMPEWLPGTSAARFRDDLRTSLMVVGIPVIMFGFVLSIWGPWLTSYLIGMWAAMVAVAVVSRARRIRAYRKRDELT